MFVRTALHMLNFSQFSSGEAVFRVSASLLLLPCCAVSCSGGEKGPEYLHTESAQTACEAL